MKKIVILVLFSVFVFNYSCVDLQFDEPIPDELPDLSANTTIKELKDMHVMGSYEKIEEDIILRGLAISSDKSGNFYKELFIQDETTGIAIRLDANNLYNDYPVGREVFVKCKGLFMSDYNGLIQLGGSVDTDDGIYLQRIPENLIAEFLIPGTRGNEVVPNIIPIADVIDADLIGTLVKFDSVQFILDDANQKYADPGDENNDPQTINRTIEDCDGNTIIIRSSGYSDFASELTPSGKGVITAVLSTYGNTRQMIIRGTDDVIMENPRCGQWHPVVVSSIDEDFQSVENYASIALEGWANIAAVGGRDWQGKVFEGNGYAQATGYNAEDPEMETWLITPGIDLSNPKNLTFDSGTAYWDHDGLTVLISTDFNGFVSTANWTELDCNLAGSGNNNYEWVASGVINLSGFSGVAYIGFRYVGNNSNHDTSYLIDNVVVEDQ